jgi:hypothetical protein
MTIAIAHFNTDTNHASLGMGYGSAERRSPDWIVVPLTLEPICRVCSNDDPLKAECRWTEPELGSACAGGKTASIPTGLDAVCGFTDYAAGITGEISLIYSDGEGWLMLSQALGQHMRQALAQDRNRLGGRR